MPSYVSLQEEGRRRFFYHTVHTKEKAKDRAERDLKILALRIGVMWSEDKESRQQPGAGRSKQ